MTAAKPLQPHGTTARAKGRPAAGIRRCSCYRCRNAENRYNKQLRYLNATGRPARVPAAPVVEHLKALKAAGMSWSEIRVASGSSDRSMIALLYGGREMVLRSMAERILAVQSVRSATVTTDATGSIRRVRALYAAGHMQRDIASAAGVDRSTVSELLGGGVERVRVATAEAVRRAFGVLEMRPAPGGKGAVRARHRALREGWAPPLAWGEDIDDPAAVPRGWVPGDGRERGAA